MADPDEPNPPLVGIVVLNYFGGEMTLRCLRSLQALTWPAERLRVALIDNGSDGDFARAVADVNGAIRYVRAPRNLGFSGGANLGIRTLDDCDLVALLNNDAVPAADWLGPLVAAIGSSDRVGAVTPKVLLDQRVATVELHSPTKKPGRGDARSLGVQLCGVRVDGEDVTDDIQLVRGFWGWELDKTTVGGPFAWTSDEAMFQIPVAAEAERPARLELRLAAGTGATVTEAAVGGTRRHIKVDVVPSWHDLGAVACGIDVINNVGADLLADGTTTDRGYLEADKGQFEEPAEVFAWSGAAVLLSRRYLDDIGLFDEGFFLYYEDSDLAWRGRLRGWRYLTAPSSVVRHQHSATLGTRSPLAKHLLERNRLLMLTKCAPRALLFRALRQLVAEVSGAIWRDVLSRPAAGRVPVLRHLSTKLRVLLGYLRLAPRALADRRIVRKGATVADDTLLEFVRLGGSHDWLRVRGR